MKIYDISQEVFSSEVYPGDPSPTKRTLASMNHGDNYNLTAFSMCAHNGTHVDAPVHFISGGDTVDKISLDKVVGKAYVAECTGILGRDEAQDVIRRARAHDTECVKRILIKGARISDEAAKIFASSGVLLLGTEEQSVGDTGKPLAAHVSLLGTGCVILEGIRLNAVADGEYFLSAAPLNLGGSDGAPCRAVLIEF